MTLAEIVATDDIYIDGNQDYALEARDTCGFKVAKLEWPGPGSCDIAWRKRDKLFAVEEKKPLDLTGSLEKRRLQRQLRRLVEACDVPIVGLRCTEPDYAAYEGFCFQTSLWTPEWYMLRLAEWQARGLVVFLPHAEVLPYLFRLRSVLTGEHPVVLAGTDQKRPEGRTPHEKALKRLFDGMGDKTAKKIITYFGGDSALVDMLAQPLNTWKAAGANKKILAQLEVYQGD